MNTSSPVTEWVQLVDTLDRPTGRAEKLDAHRRALLHRAFSVFVFDRTGRLLLQRRADGKYHSAGLWTNTACGHPRPGEGLIDAAQRRLREEMGFDCSLEPVGSLLYRLPVIGDLTEHEFDHLLCGQCEIDPQPDPQEVSAWRRVAWPELLATIAAAPDSFTPWLREILTCCRPAIETWIHEHCAG
ncbi:isopentenyl-diphosphate Delta-isomerase [Immundisolibacter sp.]|uniref:isopentenyl-diphosphate Delta-isomerase n=1 Tax=Immundisolibacter sp. TaxID=1934948 RepID=UPI00262675A8|nr:isopentenyl-diphosphate Delta-isomerase [Immundisolibacter sp.]MDD3652379.1 isopentenyl-diphosphate Delta-isomerase [Immundisolibacter sp.]